MTNLNVGITATRRRLTTEQHQWLLHELHHVFLNRKPGTTITLHHGDCTGGDAAAHDIAVNLGWYITIHPPLDGKHRAFKQVPQDGVSKILTAKKYHARNRSLVRSCSIILGIPGIPLWATQQGAVKPTPAHVVTGTELHGPQDGYELAPGPLPNSGSWHTLLVALEHNERLRAGRPGIGGLGTGTEKEVRICSIVQ